jgi:hypothetical protein
MNKSYKVKFMFTDYYEILSFYRTKRQIKICHQTVPFQNTWKRGLLIEIFDCATTYTHWGHVAREVAVRLHTCITGFTFSYGKGQRAVHVFYKSANFIKEVFAFHKSWFYLYLQIKTLSGVKHTGTGMFQRE